MTWGCKQKPNGCGWATRLDYPCGTQEWWCDTCERSGHVALRDLSQTSAPVDVVPDERATEVSAPKGTPDLATPGSDNAAGVAGTTGPTS